MIQASIVIPTRNRIQTLPRALTSALSQEGVSFEVIVVDDGSEDATSEKIPKDFPQITYLSQRNQGPAAARNRGIKASRGKWIAFLDSDDEWLPGKLRAQFDFLEQNPACRICQTEEIWIRNGRRVNPKKKHQKFGGWIFEKCLDLCLVSPSAVLIHRELFEEVGPFDESYPACEDYELWLRIASRYPIGLLKAPFVKKYGGHPDQRSREFEAMDRFRIRALATILQSGTLTPEQARATRNTLAGKAHILIQGAKKRGQINEAAKLEEWITPLISPSHTSGH